LGGWIESPFYYVLLGALCGVVGFRMGRRSGSSVILPILQALAGALATVSSWRVGGWQGGLLALVGWTVGAAALAVYAFRNAPDERLPGWWSLARGNAGRRWWRALSLLLELAACAGASLVSAGALSLLLLAVLVDRSAWRLARRPVLRGALVDALQATSGLLLISWTAVPLGARAGLVPGGAAPLWLAVVAVVCGLAAAAVEIGSRDDAA